MEVDDFANAFRKETLEMEYCGRGIDCRLQVGKGEAHDDATFCDSLVAKYFLSVLPDAMRRLFTSAVEWAKTYEACSSRKMEGKGRHMKAFVWAMYRRLGTWRICTVKIWILRVG